MNIFKYTPVKTESKDQGYSKPVLAQEPIDVEDDLELSTDQTSVAPKTSSMVKQGPGRPKATAATVFAEVAAEDSDDNWDL